MGTNVSPLDSIRNAVRSIMRQLARGLHRASGGRLTPNMVTGLGLLGHAPVVWLIAQNEPRANVLAAVLLAVFGLLDTLDGELARLQGKASAFGVFLDSTTDRFKEIILYMAAGYALIAWAESFLLDTSGVAMVVVAACGGSVLVSYINAWGEAVMSTHAKEVKHAVNKTFRGGILGFEVRMFVLIVGLAANQLFVAVIIIAVFAWITAGQRFVHVARRLT